jgi:short-subunit dehydrogenase involved in D-alanine esterification of teichoic acids
VAFSTGYLEFQTTEETSMELTNRTVLITGGASGIGYALARQFVAKGSRVIICGRNQSRLDFARAELPALDTFRCDINIADDLNRLVSFLSARYPDLDTLINNAGIQQQLDLTRNQITDQEIEAEINTNLTSHINITLRLYSLISANRNPVIVFTGSALGIVPKYEVPVYSAAKAGLHSFAQSLRYQSRQDNLQIFEIIPEVVDTPMTRHRKNESKMDPGTFALVVIRQLSADNQDIYIGRTKNLSLLNRIAPNLALKLMNKAGTV